MDNCRLNGLTFEVLHGLFDYFSAHEIFHTFHNVTSYIDAVLQTYTNYRINFKAISRHHFDLVCRYTIPEQVITLTLCGGEDTPGSIDQFLSRFQIYQFSRLQTLTLIEIGPDLWEQIITDLASLKHLKSFSFLCSNGSIQWTFDTSEDRVSELNQSLLETQVPALLQLYQLNSVQFPFLHPSTTDLTEDISLASLSRLTRIVIRISEFRVSMDVLEQMISNLVHLEHLELTANCDKDVVDGDRWQRKLEKIVTFEFMFYLPSPLQSREFDSFRTRFWLHEKQWYVAYSNQCFFSVPHFTTTNERHYFLFPQCTTAPDGGFWYCKYEQLKSIEIADHRNIRSSNIRTLVLESHPPLRSIKEAIDLGQVACLTLCSLPERFSISSLINAMPKLYRISIETDANVFLEKIHTKTFGNIRMLSIRYIFLCDTDLTIVRLSNIFPTLEHLHIGSVCLIEEILHFLLRFKHLSTASFRYMSRHVTNKEQYRSKVQSTLNMMQGVDGLRYTYQMDRSMVYFRFV